VEDSTTSIKAVAYAQNQSFFNCPLSYHFLFLVIREQLFNFLAVVKMNLKKWINLLKKITIGTKICKKELTRFDLMFFFSLVTYS
jgi:hypothetical protein